MAAASHLIRRFFGSLSPLPPCRADQEWAESQLLAGELDVWHRMSAADQRHATAVARRVAQRFDDRAVLAAALLHDAGKTVSGLGTFGRVVATLLAMLGDRRVARGRMAAYMRHDELGADLLAGAGSDPLTATWAREHHLPPGRWTLPSDVAAALKAADDD